jgi:hypothetical protein
MSPAKIIRRLLGIEKQLHKLRHRQEMAASYLEDFYAYEAWRLRHEKEIAPLVVPELSCGLGNQLFQIAAAYALARRTGSNFAVNYAVYSPGSQGRPALKYKDNLYKNIPETDAIPAYKFIETNGRPLFPMRHALLSGYYQSSKYFNDCLDEVRGLFTFPDAALTEAHDFLARDSRPTVGIHVRLGDYVGDSHRDFCSRFYFQTAMRHFSPEKYRFILCSDDPPSALRLLGRSDVEVFTGADELADLSLLSQCQNLILSNSSFSWWSWFLGGKKEKVLAPDRWLRYQGQLMGHETYDPSWIRVPVRRRWFF